MQQYYRLMKSILFVLFLSFGMISCEKEDPVSTSPGTRQTDNTDPTDPDPTDPVVRSDNEQTVFMYLPWSTDLTSFFYQNIADLKSIIVQNILKNERVLVFICTTATKATLYELSYEKGAAVQKALKSYNYPTPSYTTAEGITSILNDVQTYSPAKRYAMIIGCHGMGWIPVSKTQSRSSLQTVKKHWEYGEYTYDTSLRRQRIQVSDGYYYTCRRNIERRIEDGVYPFRRLLYVDSRGCL